MTVLIDSWAWIEYFKGGKHSKEAMSYIEGDEDSLVSSINLIEIYAWITKTYGDDVAGELMPEQGRRLNHAGMIAASEHLHIGAAGQRRADAHQNVPHANPGNGYRLDEQVLSPVQNGSQHSIVHSAHLGCGSTMIFNDSASGCCANWIPCLI